MVAFLNSTADLRKLTINFSSTMLTHSFFFYRLISNKYILTCAHCISNLPQGYEVVAVRLGEYDLRSDPDCETEDENQQECNPPVQDIPIESLIPHPRYNTPRYANDVGLIRLSETPDMTQGT